MKWEYFGTGLAFIGIGVTLMLALPPPGWPKMPPPLVHLGIIIGGTLIIIGGITAIFGMWPLFPNPRIPVLGMGLAFLLFIACAAWFWIIPEKSFSPERPLKRLIAYDDCRINADRNAERQLVLRGYNMTVQNVSDETITARTIFVKGEVDGVSVFNNSTPSKSTIIPQTRGAIFRSVLDQNVIVTTNIKEMTIEFEVDYDSMPESGIRKSYKKIGFPASPPNTLPAFGSPYVISEWEK